MKEMPRYYKILFNAVTDALAALDRQDYGVAKRILLTSQLQVEGEYMSQAERDRLEKEDR